jgi:hypothetical protein
MTLKVLPAATIVIPGADEPYQKSSREALPPQRWLCASPLRGGQHLQRAALFDRPDPVDRSYLDVAAEAGRNMRRQRETTSDDSVRGALQEQLRKTEEAYAKYDAQKQDDPATAKDRDR